MFFYNIFFYSFVFYSSFWCCAFTSEVKEGRTLTHMDKYSYLSRFISCTEKWCKLALLVSVLSNVSLCFCSFTAASRRTCGTAWHEDGLSWHEDELSWHEDGPSSRHASFLGAGGSCPAAPGAAGVPASHPGSHRLCCAAPGKHQGLVPSPVKARETLCSESSLLYEHTHTVCGAAVGAKQAWHSCGSPPSLLERKHPPAQVTMGNMKLIL